MTGTSADHYKPTQVLPRLARDGGLTRVRTSQGRILITGADETCQLVWLHNQARVWHIQACPIRGSGGGTAFTSAQIPSIRMLSPPTSQQHYPHHFTTQDTLLLSGLPTTAGQVAWYSPISQQVTQELVVTPFNTVSRTTASDKPWPPPLVTQVASAHSVLVTVDVVPTENIQAGQAIVLDKQNTVGTLTTLKFWRFPSNHHHKGINAATTANDSSSAKQSLCVCTAVVPSPHGPASHIDELALSASGRFCCTVSCGEDKSFRIWEQVKTAMDKDDNDGKTKNTHSSTVEYAWVGRYRVSIPSGFANQKVGAVTFSSDDSVLAMSFGAVNTLWDVRTGSLLNTLHHMGTHAVSRLFFMPLGPLQDTLISFSSTALVLQSPFGMHGPGNVGWSWELPHTKSQMLTDVLIIDSTTIVAALYNKTKKQTIFLVIDVTSGRIRHEVAVQQPTTRVIAMAKSSRSEECIYILTLQGSLHRVLLSSDTTTTEPLLMTSDDIMEARRSTTKKMNQIGDAPVVSVLKDNPETTTRKRKATALVLTANDLSLRNEDDAKRMRTTRLVPDDDNDANYIPRLRGPITLSFLGRNLRKGQ
jgi:hypothetical protein